MSSPLDNPSVRAEIGVIGGSGLYSFLDDAEEVVIDTPFGRPSDPLVVGEAHGRTVAFVARHGRGHRFPPHRVNYRANLWALRALGVRQVVAPCAVGSLLPDLHPGTVVVPDQILDRTSGRAATIYDAESAVVHVPFADPYCPHGRRAVLQADPAGLDVHDGGTLVVVNGPRFSTRAESRWHQAAGGTIVGMTAMPEAVLARELAMCFTTVAIVTDHDAGVQVGESVTHAEVMEVFGRNVAKVKRMLGSVLAGLPQEQARECDCPRALDGITLPFALPS